MPIGYLIGVVVVALPTLFALAPQRALPNVSFRLGLLLNEVPIIGFYWLVIGTAPAILQGDINSPGGWAILGLAAVTTAGLAVIAWRGLQARPALEQAMAEALGAGWRTAIDPELAARLRRRLPFARMLVLPLSRRRDVERVANLPYGDAGRRNLLDLYRQRAHPSGGPVLIHLHGGGYTQGRKNTQSLPLLYRLASQGWVCVSANYRLRPAAQHPEHLIDLKKVIAWVRVHGPEYGADPALLFVSGSSAGAHLAALAALTPKRPQLPARLRGCRHLGHRRHRVERLVRRLLRPRGCLLTAGPCPTGRAAVLHRPRRPRHRGAGGGRQALRGHAGQRLCQSGRLRRASRRPARLRPVRFPPLRAGRRRRRSLHRLGPILRAPGRPRPPAKADPARTNRCRWAVG
jgi:hypothetical protein